MLNQLRHDVIRAASKSIWKERHTKNFAFFCPLCSCARMIGMSPRPGQAKHFLQVGITAAFFTLLTWNWLEWKGFVSFVPFWIVFEVMYRAKVRVSLACLRCGFDPTLYLIDVDRARSAVEVHWRAKFKEKGIPYPSPRYLDETGEEIDAERGLDAIDNGDESDGIVSRAVAKNTAKTARRAASRREREEDSEAESGLA